MRNSNTNIVCAKGKLWELSCTIPLAQAYQEVFDIQY